MNIIVLAASVTIHLASWHPLPSADANEFNPGVGIQSESGYRVDVFRDSNEHTSWSVTRRFESGRWAVDLGYLNHSRYEGPAVHPSVRIGENVRIGVFPGLEADDWAVTFSLEF